ncbi:MAG: hypothetical protein PHW64_08765 [Sulfuricurvum sp.]|nr:hypothetical protein [Sulfuricurvum sp.]
MNTTPDFFDLVPSIAMIDPLADLLGAAEQGLLHYRYTDAVKLAGHSCPTVAGTYLMIQKGLKLLYGDQTPIRGTIRVTIKGKLGEGTVGVMANIVSLITGSTDISGFHGFSGKYDRRHLLFFDAEMAEEMCLERIDSEERIFLTYDPSVVPVDGQAAQWLQMILSGNADAQMQKSFQTVWQERVRKILIEFREDESLIAYRLETGDKPL